MIPSAVALIDGEHYPPVVRDALTVLSDRYRFLAAVFLGGTEKIKSRAPDVEAERLYGVPVVFEPNPVAGLTAALSRYSPEVVVDLSDEPVLGYEERFRLVSYALAGGVSYEGPGFRFTPPKLERLSASPSLSVIGTGKRVGKTAVSGYVARVLQGECSGSGVGVVVVAMGRGGPAEPQVIDGLGERLGPQDLLAWSRRGSHAASDHFEDAVLSRVTTIGCRRCGGGMAGETFVSNVAAGALAANRLDPELVIFEGSGAAIPPVATDVCLLVAGAHQPREYVTGYLGTYRLLMSDAVVLAMAEEPMASAEAVGRLRDCIGEITPDIPVVPVVFRPRPTADVAGRKVAFFSTAPAEQGKVLSRYLEDEYGCEVQFFSGSLADRPELRRQFGDPALGRVEMVLTEIKAAAIDVVAEESEKRQLPIVFVDNIPMDAPGGGERGLRDLCRELGRLAGERFRQGAGADGR